LGLGLWQQTYPKCTGGDLILDELDVLGDSSVFLVGGNWFSDPIENQFIFELNFWIEGHILNLTECQCDSADSLPHSS